MGPGIDKINQPSVSFFRVKAFDQLRNLCRDTPVAFTALAAAAEDVALAASTFSLNVSWATGGREATRRFMLYKLERRVLVSSGIYHIITGCGVNILPICAHMVPLSIAAAESNQTGVAGIGERRNRDVGID